MGLINVLENPACFGFSQKLNPFTVSLYSTLARNNIPADLDQNILDIGCGLGVHRRLFMMCQYTGVDINQDYITYARRVYGDRFFVMDAGQLRFDDAAFTQALAIATCHHLDDYTVKSMTTEALRVLNTTGALHIIDPVLPVSHPAVIKNIIFRNDRGQFQRTLSEMSELLASVGRVARVDLRRGLLHDVCYFKVTR